MSTNTGIEWTDSTWNPIRGCSRVSEGCRNCYAESVAHRFSGPGMPYEGLVRIGSQGGKHQWNGTIKFVEEHLLDPLKWKKPRRIFVNSMSDLFHENVTDAMLDRIFAVMALCPQHTFQVLTKRPERMLAYLTPTMCNYQPANVYDAADEISHSFIDREATIWPLPNVQLGVSVENQKAADERIPLLLRTPATVRFLSCEPLLGAVDIDQWFIELDLQCDRFVQGTRMEEGYCEGCAGHTSDPVHHSKAGLIDWVIVGGESGPGARPMHPDWARSLRDQCVAAGVPFFFKQWGEWIPWEPGHEPCWESQHGKSEDSHALFPENIADNPRGWDCGLGFESEENAAFQRVGKKAAGALLDGREWREMPA